MNSPTVPLYRYWNGKGCDHFYTIEWCGPITSNDWVFEGIECYV